MRQMRHHFSMRHGVTMGISLAVLALLCASPSLLGDRVHAAVRGLGDARPGWLWLAALAFVATGLAGAFAWRAALRACGTRLGVADAAARYCTGSGVNAIAPAHVGSAVRVALFGRVTQGGCWTVGGAAAAVGVTRVVWLGGLIALGSAGGVLPAWPLLAIAGLVAAAAAAGLVARRLALPRRVDQLLAAFRALAGSPRDLALVAGWALAGAVAKVAAAAAIVASLGVEHPLRDALVVVPAVELAAVLPVTPGNVGVASAAVAFVLGAQNVASATALAVGIAFGAVELLVALAVGLAGVLALAGPRLTPQVRLAVAGAASLAVASAIGATMLLPVV